MAFFEEPRQGDGVREGAGIEGFASDPGLNWICNMVVCDWYGEAWLHPMKLVEPAADKEKA
ncbi:MAG: hypothetical protein EXS06_00725 [Planctomycetaceae bacterium]|nr:hypothetical protein [Planctomycetaceae bacterium]